MKSPSRASCTWAAAPKRTERPRIRHHAKRIAEASANRSATLASGGALPSWKVMAIQVVPQIATAAANRRGVVARMARPRSARVDPGRIGAHHAGLHGPPVHPDQGALRPRREDPEVA